MDFSETFAHSNAKLCKCSPNGKYLATPLKYRLVIRDSETLQIVQLFCCIDLIDIVEWSEDSKYILCGLLKRACTQIWSIDQPEWICKIDEGATGLSNVMWAISGRHILTVADFQASNRLFM
jgi:hypothetical protein